MTEALMEAWARFQTGLAERNQRLVSEFENAGRDLESLLKKQSSSWNLIESWSGAPERIDSFRDLFEEPANALLCEPIEIFLQCRPVRRTLDAIENHQSELEALTRLAPTTVSVTRKEFIDLIGAPPVILRWLALLRWGRGPRELPLRSLVGDQLRKQALFVARLQGACVINLARAALEVNTPWQTMRGKVLGEILGAGRDAGATRARWNRWLGYVADCVADLSRSLPSIKAHAGPLGSRVGAGILRNSKLSSEKRRREEIERLRSCFAYWVRHQRAVAGLLRLDRDLIEVARQASVLARSSLDSLDSEHKLLLQELDVVIAWLAARQEGESEEAFPPPQAQLISAEERMSDWAQLVSAAIRAKIPAVVEAVNPQDPLPGRRSPWRQVRPQAALLSAMEGVARRHAREGFQEAETAHRAIVREIERARQVVEFGLEETQRGGESATQVASEAIRNALALLEHQKQTTTDVRPGVEKHLTLSLASAFHQCHIEIEQGRLGLWTHLAREGGRQAAELAWRSTRTALRQIFDRAGSNLRKIGERFLISIGWLRPAGPRQQHVVRRPYFSESLGLDFRPRELPAIYRRLFRPEPLEDPRLLIGRGAEMAALVELRQLWESGRPAAAIVVGDRGSGKTSLLNCAETMVFHGTPLVRGQFQDRIRTSDDMRRFLAGLFGFPEGTASLQALAGQRKLVMIEEVERSFLRTVNGYQGLLDLLGLIAATSHHILWILVINRTAFQFLRAAVKLEDFFSHRINTVSVELQDLKAAILVRHNLSGLRLHYAAPPPEAEAKAAARRYLGFGREPEHLFFDALYRESEGVFRSAFELWQGYVDRVEGGVLYLRHPTEPHYESLVSTLTLDELFTLQAILQHGGLTMEEHALIFQSSEQESHTRLEALQDRELAQPDPTRPGFRVWPEAARLVREALHRRNLL